MSSQNRIERGPRLRLLSVVAAALAMVFGLGAASQANAATASISATYYLSMTYFTTVRTHSTAGPISYENLSGKTQFADGTWKAQGCGSTDIMALRGTDGTQFASLNFWPTTYNWKSFPLASYSPRSFMLAFRMQGQCGSTNSQVARAVTGNLYY